MISMEDEVESTLVLSGGEPDSLAGESGVDIAGKMQLKLERVKNE
jgi:hypothetical protein